MPTLKRLVCVVAIALFVILGAASGAGADISAAQPGTAPSNPSDPTGGLPPEGGVQLPVPAPPPPRREDPPPDPGVAPWVWIVVALSAGVGASVALLLWRGSRAPKGADPMPWNTEELVAVGRGQTLPPPRKDIGEVR